MAAAPEGPAAPGITGTDEVAREAAPEGRGMAPPPCIMVLELGEELGTTTVE